MSDLRRRVGELALSLMDEIDGDVPESGSVDMIVSYPVGALSPWQPERSHRVMARWTDGALDVTRRSKTESRSRLGER